MKFDFHIQKVEFKFKTFGTGKVELLINGEQAKNINLSKKNIIRINFTKDDPSDVSSYALDLMDMGGYVLDEKNPVLNNVFQKGLLFSTAMRIAGGTDEVLRNIIAERVLGLPQDTREDKTKPFNELPSGKTN